MVSITSARFVNKGPGHPAHTDDQRLYQMKHLRMVDAAFISDWPDGSQSILAVRPAYFVKGIDYSGRGICAEERQACSDVGAQIIYTRSPKMSVREMVQKFQPEGRS